MSTSFGWEGKGRTWQVWSILLADERGVSR